MVSGIATMDTRNPLSPISFVLFVFLVVLCSFPAIRSESEPNIIRLPSDSEPADPCGGSTRSASMCPINCFRPDPVCGVDSGTYWCGCPEAQCVKVAVAKIGFCEVGNGGAAPHSAQALLLVHIVWLIVLGFSVLFGLF